MILSSADILRVLGGSEIIRLAARLKIVDGKPPLSGAEGLFIYVDRFPRLGEFQATWTIYVESDGSEPDDLILAEIKKLLPGVIVKPGLMTTVTTTEFLSESTQRPAEAPKPVQVQVDLTQYEERFQSLVEDVQDQMLLVTSGRAGKDGKDGAPGAPGRDGRDIDATETELFELKDVDQSVLPMEKGQVLTWDGAKWTNLYIPDRQKFGGGGGTDGGDTVDSVNGQTGVVVLDADGIDDTSTVNKFATAAQLALADSSVQPGDNVSDLTNDAGYITDAGVTQIIAGANITIDPVNGTGAVTINAANDTNDADGGDFGALPNPDAGDFEAGTSTSTLAYPVDGGDFEADTTEAFGDSSFDGGVVT